MQCSALQCSTCCGLGTVSYLGRNRITLSAILEAICCHEEVKVKIKVKMPIR